MSPGEIAFQSNPKVRVRTDERALARSFGGDGGAYPGTLDLLRTFKGMESVRATVPSCSIGVGGAVDGWMGCLIGWWRTRGLQLQRCKFLWVMGQDTMNSYVQGRWKGR